MSGGGMKLVICTPSRVAARLSDVRYVRATDASGGFGVQPRHADLVSALDISVVSWTLAKGDVGFAAVRGGVLVVRGGDVAIAAPEAVVGADLAALEASVLARMRAQARDETRARQTQARMERTALRLFYHYVSPEAASGGRQRTWAE